MAAMYYSEQQIGELINERESIEQKYNAILLGYTGRQYVSVRGREFGTQGLARRFGTLCRCIDRIFAILPPNADDVPSKDAREDATIAVQAFIFNAFGCLDNLARIWVEEKSVRKPNGNPLSQSMIGMGSKYERVRASFSAAFQDYLASREDWFAYLDNFRHALAHRIPLYIPPHAVTPENQAAYQTLGQEITAASLHGNLVLETQLQEQQKQLMFFRPWIVHSFEENAPMIVIHPQMLADFNTVDEIAWKILDELQ